MHSMSQSDIDPSDGTENGDVESDVRAACSRHTWTQVTNESTSTTQREPTLNCQVNEPETNSTDLHLHDAAVAGPASEGTQTLLVNRSEGEESRTVRTVPSVSRRARRPRTWRTGGPYFLGGVRSPVPVEGQSFCGCPKVKESRDMECNCGEEDTGKNNWNWRSGNAVIVEVFNGWNMGVEAKVLIDRFLLHNRCWICWVSCGPVSLKMSQSHPFLNLTNPSGDTFVMWIWGMSLQQIYWFFQVSLSCDCGNESRSLIFNSTKPLWGIYDLNMKSLLQIL